jgi:hypothetical protein
LSRHALCDASDLHCATLPTKSPAASKRSYAAGARRCCGGPRRIGS